MEGKCCSADRVVDMPGRSLDGSDGAGRSRQSSCLNSAGKQIGKADYQFTTAKSGFRVKAHYSFTTGGSTVEAIRGKRSWAQTTN